MHKDLKIGLVLGLILVTFVILRLVTDPRLGTKARMEQADSELMTDTPAAPPITETITSQPTDKNFDSMSLQTEQPENEINNPVTNSTRIVNVKPENRDNADISLSSENKQSQVPEQDEIIKPQKFHIVTKGQTLSDIAYKYYGAASKWQKIFNANRNVLSDPDKLQPGMKLIIPE